MPPSELWLSKTDGISFPTADLIPLIFALDAPGGRCCWEGTFALSQLWAKCPGCWQRLQKTGPVLDGWGHLEEFCSCRRGAESW